MKSNESSRRVENRILASLPGQDRERLLAHLEPVPLPLGKVLYEADRPIDYVYFIETGMVSLVSVTEEGETFEVGIVGYGGIVGATVFLEEKTAQRAVVQAEGTALRMPASTFKDDCEHIASLQN